MKLRIKFDFSVCNKIEASLVALIMLFTIIKMNSLISLCFALSFIVLLLYVVQRARTKTFWVCPLALIALSIFNVITNGLTATDANLNFEYFKKVIMFSAFVLMCYLSTEDTVSADVTNMTLDLPCIEGIMLVLSYFLLGNTGVQAGGITLGFTNSNFAGMWLLHISIYTFLFLIKDNTSWFRRVIALVFLVIQVWLLIMTKARSCMIAIVLFAIFCLIGRIGQSKVINNSITIGCIVVLPIVVVAGYSTLLSSNWFVNTFSFMVSAGKGLNSRSAVWEPAIEIFKKNVILGNYAKIENGIGLIQTKQLHNMHLDVLCSYGIVPFLIFLFLLYWVCNKMGKKATNYFSYCAFCGFLCVIVLGIFEAGVVAGSMGMNLLTTGLLLLANNYASPE